MFFSLGLICKVKFGKTLVSARSGEGSYQNDTGVGAVFKLWILNVLPYKP